MSRIGLGLVAGLLAFSAQAGVNAEHPDLPPLASVRAALLTHPSVLAARAGVEMGEAARERITAGPHEFVFRLGNQQRSVNNADQTTQRFREWEVGVERALRLPGKATLDASLGDAEAGQARMAHGDALHEAGRGLLKAWFGWARESAAAQQWEGQAALLKDQVSIADKRVQAGDAPKLERNLAEAALAQAESMLHQFRLKAQLAANELTRRFPGIALPAKLPEIAPEPITRNADYWREEIIRHSHELAVARGETRMSRLGGERAQAEQMPDPTLGLRTASDKDGAERVLGVTISIPFSGAARSARTRELQAQAGVSAQREAAALRKIELEALNSFAAAQASYSGWQGAQLAAGKMESNAALMTRAYALGEIALPEVLTARRQSLEAGLSAALTRIDAVESRYRLLLDAHQLWVLDGDDEGEGEGHKHE